MEAIINYGNNVVEVLEEFKKKVKKEIEKLAKEKYGDLEGIAQQYLFYWRREQ